MCFSSQCSFVMYSLAGAYQEKSPSEILRSCREQVRVSVFPSLRPVSISLFFLPFSLFYFISEIIAPVPTFSQGA
jgi:hypothetical protein